MTTISYGTCHFQTKRDAINYYKHQGETADDINRKAKEGEIAFGPPEAKAGETFWLDEDRRYHIREMNFAELSSLTRFVVDDTGNGRRIGSDPHAIVRKAGVDDFCNRSVFAIFQVPNLGDQYVIIAVNSYLDAWMDDKEVEEIASDYMTELFGVANLSRVMRG
jgi:hypothetical protein